MQQLLYNLIGWVIESIYISFTFALSEIYLNEEKLKEELDEIRKKTTDEETLKALNRIEKMLLE